jgi:DNA-directed RNA polymerase specialized sigma24 family protein
MVNIIGEFKSVRANNIQAVVEGQRDHAEAIDSEGQTGAKAATGGTACVAGDARTVPKAVTLAERLEERLGNAMLKEALHNPRIPNPEKWSKARNLALARRTQLSKERRARVKMYVEEGELTVNEVAEILGCVPTTIRTDLQVLRMKLKPAVVQPSAYQFEIHERRFKLEEMADLGITRSEAASRLGVSEATIRRDIMVMRLKWDEE